MSLHPRNLIRLIAVVAAVLLLAGACSDSDGSTDAGAAVESSDDTSPPGEPESSDQANTDDGESDDEGDDEPVATDGTAPEGAGPAGSCPDVSAEQPEGPTSEVQTFDVDGVEVGLAVYPRPDYEGNPWSHWGQGIVLPDGRFVSAIGDHVGVDGNSFLFVHDPETGQLTQFGDVLSVVGHEDGSFGHGKVHAQMVQTSCDSVIIGTYWGTRRNMAFEGSYTGGHLLRLDPSTLDVESLGVPVEGHAIPSMAGHDGLVYGEAAAPVEVTPPEQGVFFVYDPESGEVVYESDTTDHGGFRSILVTGEGDAYVAGLASDLLQYSPDGELSPAAASMPEGWLRAVAEPTDSGVVYGVSRQPERFFAMAPDGTIEDLGAAAGYTTTMVLDSDEKILYVPGAHGSAWETDTPVLRFDPESGTEETLVALNSIAEQELGLTLGGTYSMAIDEERGRLFVEFNAGPTRDDPWGEVVLAVIEL